MDTTGEDRLSIYQFTGKPGVIISLGSDMMRLFKAEGYEVRKLVCVQGNLSKREIDQMSKRWNTPDFPSSAEVVYPKHWKPSLGGVADTVPPSKGSMIRPSADP